MSEEKALAQEFAERFAELSAGKGDDLTLTDIRLAVESLTQRGGESLYDKILKIAVKLHHLRDEFAHVDPDKVSEEKISQANLRLEAAVKETEEATNKILDSAQAIESNIGDLTGDAKQNIAEEITKIYEACNFQDLSGQHINKVINTLLEIEELVKSLIKLLPDDFKDNVKQAAASDDEKLLHGPNFSGDTPSQDDIDKIFAEC